MPVRSLTALVLGVVAGMAAPHGTPPRVDRPLYMTNSATPDVARFAVRAGGTVTPVDTAVASLGARGMVFTPDLRYAYTSSFLAGVVDLYRVGPRGALTRSGSVAVPGAFGIAIAPNGRTVYVDSFSGGTLTAFTVQRDGSLARPVTVDTGAPEAKGVAVTPDGRYVYVSHGQPTDTAPTTLTGLAIGADGRPLRRVAQVGIGISGAETVITPDGRFVYVVCQRTDDVFGFRVHADGSLTSVTRMSTGEFPEGAAVSPDGRYLRVARLGPAGAPPGAVIGYAIDGDGTLAPTTDSYPLADPVGIAYGPDGRHVYVSDYFSGTLTVFAVGSRGALAPIQTVPSGGTRPAFHAVSVLPDLGPVASFTATAGAAGAPSRFGAEASTDPDGWVAWYDWDFGDGHSARSTGPRVRHTYRAPGTYRVRLTVTDNENCSTRFVYTGQSAMCTGSAAATTSRTLRYAAGSTTN